MNVFYDLPHESIFISPPVTAHWVKGRFHWVKYHYNVKQKLLLYSIKDHRCIFAVP